MSNDRVFVGRKDELRRFREEVLEKPDGQAVVVIGAEAMGKTWLVDEMASSAASHPTVKCGHVRYECTPNDTPDVVMSNMMDHAYECGGVKEKSFDKTPHRLRQWKALFGVFSAGDLFECLQRDPKGPTREQFIKALERVSERMKDNQRAIFVIDPEKYMSDNSADEWRIVVRNLPPKIKFIFAQRPEDQLATRYEFLHLPNVVVIPKESLHVLDEKAVEEFLEARRDKLPPGTDVLAVRAALARYQGHPYAINAAIGLLADGVPLAELPHEPKPTEFARAQWRRLCDEHGETAIKLLTAYAILEVPVPDDVAEAVAEVSPVERRKLLANPFVDSLLRAESDGRRVYHVLLSEHILGDTTEDERKPYHQRAIDVYRARLKREGPPDLLAATRLPEHVLVVEGKEAFLRALVDESTPPLRIGGAFGVSIALSDKAIRFTEERTLQRAMIYGTLGVVHYTRSELDRAEDLFNEALDILTTLECVEGMASGYTNLGNIQLMRGDLDRAEDMYKKALAIESRLGRPKGISCLYSNLGVIQQKRGDLDQAEEMFNNSLAIETRLGCLEGMASDYGNLGNIQHRRGEFDRAEVMYNKALKIETRIGHLQGMATACGNLGIVHKSRGDLDRAEEMHRKALEIDTRLGRLEGMAKHYGNLGIVYESRGDVALAREYWTKARDLFAKMGVPHEVAKLQKWLDELPPDGAP